MVIQWWVAVAVVVVVVSVVTQSAEWLLAIVAIGMALLLVMRRNDKRAEPPAIERRDEPAVFDPPSGVSPEIRAEIAAKVAEDYPETAAVAYTAAALADLLDRKLPEWPWALFVSSLGATT